jgi:hypothetical protein
MADQPPVESKQFSLSKTERIAVQRLATERNVDVRDLEKGLAILWRKKEEPQPEAEIIEADFEDTSAASED